MYFYACISTGVRFYTWISTREFLHVHISTNTWISTCAFLHGYLLFLNVYIFISKREFTHRVHFYNVHFHKCISKFYRSTFLHVPFYTCISASVFLSYTSSFSKDPSQHLTFQFCEGGDRQDLDRIWWEAALKDRQRYLSECHTDRRKLPYQNRTQDHLLR